MYSNSQILFLLFIYLLNPSFYFQQRSEQRHIREKKYFLKTHGVPSAQQIALFSSSVTQFHASQWCLKWMTFVNRVTNFILFSMHPWGGKQVGS